ncbi:hypothetical protein F4780DRAFT_737940 [Xylariomycetidae sp. FL0641]|nr:hypothetical protein F4780DRAFT_737940 [Xylariomycetidae sp. FL0641]
MHWQWLDDPVLHKYPWAGDRESFDQETQELGASCTAYKYAWENDACTPREWMLSSQQDWDRWFQDLGVGDNGTTVSPERQARDCVYILCVPKVKDVTSGIPASLTDLPFSERNFQKVLQAFWLLPGHVLSAISRQAVSSSTIWHPMDDPEGGTLEVVMHMSVTPKKGYGAFALASTYVESTGTTFAMVLGCSQSQMDDVKKILEHAKYALGHPSLLLGISVELYEKRLEQHSKDACGECVRVTRDLEEWGKPGNNQGQEDKKSVDEKQIWGLITRVRDCRNRAKNVEEEARTTKQQLEKVFNQELTQYSVPRRLFNTAGVQKPGRPSPDPPLSEEEVLMIRFRDRFADVLAKLDGHMAECRIGFEEMSFAADIIRSELARQEAELSRQEAKHSAQSAKLSTVIAFVAMLFLPMTTTATIFAMPIFGWDNNWRDRRWHSVKGGDSKDSGSDNEGNDQQPVFSGYFYIYFAVSFALTFFTIDAWWQFAMDDRDPASQKHWVAYLPGIFWRQVKRAG